MYYIHVEITKWEVPNNSDGRKCYYRMFTYPHTIDKTCKDPHELLATPYGLKKQK